MREPHLNRYGDAYVADDATVTGRVTLGPDVSVWYGTVIRADVAAIAIGRRTNVQDMSVVHPQHDEDITIGEEVTIGHGVLLHCRSIGSLCLIGMGSILLPGARIGDGCLVGAGSLVTLGKTIPDRSLVMGSPAKVVRQLTDREVQDFRESAERYVALSRVHLRP
jgi:carbonic anhydrase/acetyltransferase-like protein (isoleucine patch superfamily)